MVQIGFVSVCRLSTHHAVGSIRGTSDHLVQSFHFHADGSVWYVSRSGRDEAGCGRSEAKACHSLQFLLGEFQPQRNCPLNLVTDTDLLLNNDLFVSFVPAFVFVPSVIVSWCSPWQWRTRSEISNAVNADSYSGNKEGPESTSGTNMPLNETLKKRVQPTPTPFYVTDIERIRTHCSGWNESSLRGELHPEYLLCEDELDICQTAQV